jgi:hypothetical protein
MSRMRQGALRLARVQRKGRCPRVRAERGAVEVQLGALPRDLFAAVERLRRRQRARMVQRHQRLHQRAAAQRRLGLRTLEGGMGTRLLQRQQQASLQL